MLWDIFCKVVDNYGDIGVCWRLSADLASRGEQVRLWVDDARALAWMAPGGCNGVQVMPWTLPFQDHGTQPGDVLIEAFGCDVAPEFIADYADSARAAGSKISWINLEYLSAEPYAKRSHGLPSPVMTGPGAGLTKHFFYPGFTAQTGGLLHERGLLARQSVFDRNRWLAEMDIPFKGERLISLFCYAPPALKDLLQQLAADPTPTRLLVTSGLAATAVSGQTNNEKGLLLSQDIHKSLSISYIPSITQSQFDELLWACDVNFVRGEDSLVRAIWAGKPLVWQLYPQHDNAHHAKLEAFLEETNAPPSLRRFHHIWNSLEEAALPALEIPNWTESATLTKTRLLAQHSLSSQLIRFATKKR